MLTLIYYQFQYSKKQWLATLPVLFVASIVGGTAVNGIISLSKYPSLANTDNGPSVVFNGLIIFGGLTLFLLVSGLIRFLMALFRKDYELWTILGTNRSQLSFLVGGQLFIVAFLFSLPGALLSTVTTQIFYNYLQTELGKELMPPMSISFDFFGVFVTIFIVSSIAAISGYRYTWKNLKKTSRQHFGFYLWRILGPLIVFSTWIGCIVFIFSPLSISENEAMTIKMSLVTMLLLLNLMIAQFISPYIQVFVIRCLGHLMSLLSYHSVISKWLVLYDRTYLKVLQSTITMGITLVSGFQIFLTGTGKDNALLSFLMYLLAPLLLLLANVISLTLLSSEQTRKDSEQFRMIGLTKINIGIIRVFEAFFHSLTAFVVSLLFNIIIFMSSNHISKEFHNSSVESSGLYKSGIVISLIFLIFIFITKIINVPKLVVNIKR